MATSKRGPVPGSEHAKHGGQAVRAKYGADYFRQIGQKGGQRVKEKQGPTSTRRLAAKVGKRPRRTTGRTSTAASAGWGRAEVQAYSWLRTRDT